MGLNERKKTHRQTLAIGLGISSVVHAAVLTLGVTSIPLVSSSDDEALNPEFSVADPAMRVLNLVENEQPSSFPRRNAAPPPERAFQYSEVEVVQAPAYNALAALAGLDFRAVNVPAPIAMAMGEEDISAAALASFEAVFRRPVTMLGGNGGSKQGLRERWAGILEGARGPDGHFHVPGDGCPLDGIAPKSGGGTALWGGTGIKKPFGSIRR